jgi:hypothetical protein
VASNLVQSMGSDTCRLTRYFMLCEDAEIARKTICGGRGRDWPDYRPPYTASTSWTGFQTLPTSESNAQRAIITALRIIF